MRRIGAWVLFVSLALAAPPGASAEESGSAPPAPGSSEPVLHGELRLSLDDAIAMAVENNLDVEIARHAPLIALADHRIAWGAYDPELATDYGFSWVEQPTSSVFQRSGTTEQLWDGSSGVRGLVPYVGASYALEYTGRKLTTDSSVQGLSPEYRAGLRLNVDLPLMRDLFWSAPWTEVKTSQVRYQSELENFRRDLMDTVRNTQGAYWNLVAAAEQLRVERKSQETARALLDQTRIQYDVGVVSRVEVTEAEAGVAEREVNLIRAENLYRSSQDRLIDLVLGPYLEPMSRLEIQPVDDPNDWIVYEIDVEEATTKAFTYRPELKVARSEIERRRLLLKFAENQRLPQLDLEAFYGMTGLSGDTNEEPSFIDRILSQIPGAPPPPARPVANQSFGDAHDTFFHADKARQWGARGVFSIPLGNRAARHRVSQSQLLLRRARTETRRLEQSIVLEVRQAARDLKSAQEGIRAAERRRLAAAEQLRAERIRLEHGESTPFDVLQRERDFVDSESQKIAALQLYHTSVADLERAQGTTLRGRNIRVEEAAQLR